MGLRVRHVTTLLLFRACRSSWRNCNDQLYSKLHVSMTKTLSWEKKSAHDDDGELLQKIQLQCSSVAWLVVVFMGLWSEDRRLLWPSSPSFFFVGSGIVVRGFLRLLATKTSFDDVKNLSIECTPKMTFVLAPILGLQLHLCTRSSASPSAFADSRKSLIQSKELR